MRQRDNLLLVVLVLGAIAWLAYRGGEAGAFGGEEPLVKKVACDKCAADGTVGVKDPLPDRGGLIPTWEQRIFRGEKLNTRYCRHCQGLGYMLQYRNGRKEPATTKEEKELFEARINALNMQGLVAKLMRDLDEAKLKLAESQKLLEALEKKQQEKKQTEDKAGRKVEAVRDF